ncbi:hypothetical protein, partial [Ilyomonas limi]|uniref:hypothetical protein n=1 Tax=Ilyomonas limi TaxID=2575867 RepID=UPI0014851CFD
DIHNDTIKLIHYDSYGYIHSLHKDNTKGEAELRGTNPKRLEIIWNMVYIATYPNNNFIKIRRLLLLAMI